MGDNLESALSLLMIGMITVFIVLALVVAIGNILIIIINKYFSKEPTLTQNINPQKLAAISAAVESVSDGQARIQKIEKL
jgi:oxaloacetate decarboxylase gamma subunit